MIVLMFEHRFVPKIRSGEKLHTIRAIGKREVKVGDDLSLRHWHTTAYRSPKIEIFPGELLPCTGVIPITLHQRNILFGAGHTFPSHVVNSESLYRASSLDLFAQSDGFDDWAQMRDYWIAGNGLPFSGNLVSWEGWE